MGAQSKSEELMGTSQRELVTSASRRSRTIARRLDLAWAVYFLGSAENVAT